MCDVILLLSQSCGVELTCLGEIRHVDADALAVPSGLLLLTNKMSVFLAISYSFTLVLIAK